MAEGDRACNSIPAVITHDYAPKGSSTVLAGLSLYYVGPTTATRALIAVDDIFGFKPQTFQGADRLASSLNALVLMPDFFEGEPLSLDVHPVNTDERKKIVTAFMTKKADLSKNKGKLDEVVSEAKKRYTNVERWGVYGLCWGGKIAALACGPNSAFQAAGAAHPGRLAKEDAAALTVPFICLFSKEDGTPELVEEYTEALEINKQNVVEKYGTMHHGWMGVRANLKDEENVKEFQRGYNQLAEFFAKNL